ncbi:MAG: CHAP domain-containing protein [Varibaculum cambriense]|nr:CHAP domain-containing protein [Varibaculum cambriense]
MATANDILRIARSQLGYTATSTSGKFCDWYGLKGYWCAMFVSWVANQAGATAIIPRHSYTPTGANWFKQRGRWHSGTRGLAPGDVVYFDFGLGRISHVGIFEGWDRGRVVTIDGNTGSAGGRSGGRVLRRARAPRYIVGYGRPAYASRPAASGIAVDGWAGRATVRRAQQLAHTPQDGYISGQWRGNRKAHWAVVVMRYGRGGSTLVRRIQAAAGVKADGHWGANTSRAMQRRLGVAVDGYFGNQSVKAWQRVLNAGRLI